MGKEGTEAKNESQIACLTRLGSTGPMGKSLKRGSKGKREVIRKMGGLENEKAKIATGRCLDLQKVAFEEKPTFTRCSHQKNREESSPFRISSFKVEQVRRIGARTYFERKRVTSRRLKTRRKQAMDSI